MIPLNSIQVRKPARFPTFNVRNINSQYRNLLVGLSDDEGFLQQIGVLASARTEFVQVFSKPVSSLRLLELGYVKLLRDGTELGFVDK